MRNIQIKVEEHNMDQHLNSKAVPFALETRVQKQNQTDRMYDAQPYQHISQRCDYDCKKTRTHLMT